MSEINTKKFSIDLNANDGALLRVFGLIERRGHRIITMHSFMPTPTTFKLEVEIEAGTPRQDVLIHQIMRLADVINASDLTAAELQAGMQANILRYSRHDMMYV
jgi:acetolactate synthase regulatory subunit